VIDLKKAKTAQAKEIVDLKKRVKKLEKKKKLRTSDVDEDLSLIDETTQDQERLNEEKMFGVDDLDGEQVIMDVTTSENVEQDATVAEKEVSTADPVTTAGEVVTTTKDVKGTTAATT
nr:hypothetical protein [Tanacetum cinerariifolium]